MTLNQSQYSGIIIKQFLDNRSLSYFIFIKPNAIHKASNKERKILTKEKKSWYF